MKSVAWQKRERRVRYAIIRDMITHGWLTCKPISQRRDTRELAAQSTRRIAVARAETVTCATEHAR